MFMVTRKLGERLQSSATDSQTRDGVWSGKVWSGETDEGWTDVQQVEDGRMAESR